MTNIGIYKIENKINGKVYIGQSQNIFKRWSVHGNKNKANNCNMVIAKAITKYGVENFRFEILELCTKEELNIKEKHWVSVYNSYKNGYNSTTGGDAPDEFAFSKLTKDTVKILLQELKANIIPMVDLAKKYNVAESTIRGVNTGNAWVTEGIEYPIRKGNTAYIKLTCLPAKYCKICNKNISKYTVSGMCKSCQSATTRKCVWPSKIALIAGILKLSQVELGKIYNVSDNTIKKWCKSYNIPYTKQGFKKLKWTPLLGTIQHPPISRIGALSS